MACYMIEWDLQGELVQGQKCSSRPTEVEGNCGCPIPPMGQRGQDDDDDDDEDDDLWLS